MNKQLKAAIKSWLRATIASLAALYGSGITDPKILANALIAGLLGPAIKALSPSETELGIGSK